MPSSAEHSSSPDEDTLEAGGTIPNQEHDNVKQPIKQFLRQKAERFEFSLLATEDDDTDQNGKGEQEDPDRPYILKRRQSLKPTRHNNLWKQAMAHMKKNEDPFGDLPENHKVVLEAKGIKQIRVPSLLECRQFLENQETDKYKERAVHPTHMLSNLILNVFAAFIIWFINMISLETVVVVINAAGAAYFFAERREDW